MIAVLLAIGLGGGLMWTMRSAFSVGEDMIRSVDDSRPIAHAKRREGNDERSKYVRAAPKVEPRDGQHLVGRVVFPAGTPQDEVVDVVAYERAVDPVARVRVGADGRFELPFPERMTWMHVELEARYLFLDVETSVRRDALATDLVLEPELGAWIVGRATVPAGRDDLATSFVGEPIGVAFDFDAHAERCPHFAKALATKRGGHDVRPIRSCSSKLDEKLAFELRGVLPSDANELDVDRDRFEECAPFATKPGEKVELAIAVRPMPSISGSVVDEHGKPVVRAQCQIVVSGSSTAPIEPVAVLVTHDDGTFGFLLSSEDLDARRDGARSAADVPLFLRVRAPAYQPFVLELGRVDRAERRDGIVVRLKHELAIRGTVVWPDGHPASEAAVSVDALDASPSRESSRGEGNVVRADEDGRFEIAPLGDGPYRVLARASETFDNSDEDEIGRYETHTGVALAPSVAGGTDDLVLHLGAGRVLHGRVRDSDGLPIASFGVQARPVLGGTVSWLPAHELGDSFQDGEGRFTLKGLHDGEWEVQASYRGFRSAAQRVNVGGGENAIDLVLDKMPTITGRVVDEKGEPVVGAQIELDSGRSFRSPKDDDGQRARARSDADGRFAFDHVDPGQVSIVASTWRARVAMRSQPLVLDIQPNQRVQDVTLSVGLSGGVRGVVVDARGKPADGATVIVIAVRPTFGDRERWVLKAGANGSFELGGLWPGSYVAKAQLHGTSGKTSEFAVEREITELSIELAPAVPWRIAWTGSPTEAAPLLESIFDEQGARVEAFDEGGPRRGTIASGTLPAGAYRVVLHRGPRTFERELRLSGTAEVVLEVGPDE